MDYRENHEKNIAKLEFEIEKYKKAIKDSGMDYYDLNLDTGGAEQSFVIGKNLGLEPGEYDTIQKIMTYFHPDDIIRNQREIDKVINGEIDQYDMQSRLIGKNGNVLWLQHTGVLCIDPITKEKHLVGIMRDITKEKTNIESLHYLANYDGLTNTLSRRSGMMKLDGDVSKHDMVTVIYIDVDNFKHINDHYGHAAGDTVLKQLCKKIMEFMPEDSYLVRLGGDEFLCVILHQLPGAIDQMMENIKGSPIMYGNHLDRTLSFSYGIVKFDRNIHKSTDELIREADEQMYHFKNSSKW